MSKDRKLNYTVPMHYLTVLLVAVISRILDISPDFSPAQNGEDTMLSWSDDESGWVIFMLVDVAGFARIEMQEDTNLTDIQVLALEGAFHRYRREIKSEAFGG